MADADQQPAQELQSCTALRQVPTPKLAHLTSRVSTNSLLERGTVEHRIFEGEKARAFVDGANLAIQVNCRADAGELSDAFPSRSVASLEVAQTSQIAIYEEISARIRPQVEIEPGSRKLRKRVSRQGAPDIHCRGRHRDRISQPQRLGDTSTKATCDTAVGCEGVRHDGVSELSTHR